MSLNPFRRQPARRSAFRPELGTLEGRALMTQIGVAAPRAAGVVQVQNAQGKSNATAGFPLTAMAGNWKGQTWTSVVGYQVLGGNRSEYPTDQRITVSQGTIQGVEDLGTGESHQWSIRPLGGGRLELTIDPIDSFDTGYGPITLQGAKTGLNTWTFESTTPSDYPRPNVPIRFTFTFINRNTMGLLKAAEINGQWETLQTVRSVRTSATPNGSGQNVAGLPLTTLVGNWQGRFSYTKFGATQLNRPNSQGSLVMDGSMKDGVLILNQSEPDAGLRHTFVFRRLSEYRYIENTYLDDQYDGGVETPDEPGRQVGLNSYMFQYDLPDNYPSVFDAYRRMYTMLNRDRFQITFLGLKDGRWDLLRTSSLFRVPTSNS